ncbi:MAG: response regulator [Symploca sp. SIO1B1]|nr:response regulator [Symploca sp. SIO2D2]NER20310.1 response regulator [Symploca sp. SIO1C2]NER46885.1 response regulator [Symploca sp. SIO1A3]NER92941.1 response regulator [Symploca sp. SIO1B1]
MKYSSISTCSEPKFNNVTAVKDYTIKPPLVLVVDDDEDNLLLMTHVLDHLGCSWITAVDGMSALQKAQTAQPALILLDILMPHMNGAEVLARLKENSKVQKIPVIAVTALANTSEREDIMLAGFDDYVSKPYMLEEVEAALERHLRLPAAMT